MAEMKGLFRVRQGKSSTWLVLAIVLVLCGVPGLARAAITCPAGWSCISEADAVARWGQNGFDQYLNMSCGVDLDFQTYFHCYRQATFTPCPSGYTCMAEADAIARWGAGNFVKSSGNQCGMDPDFVPYSCFTQSAQPTLNQMIPPRITVPIPARITPLPVIDWVLKLPIARFTYRDTSVWLPMPIPYQITFNATSSTSYYGIAGYSWNFGDGSPEVSTASPVISHQYRSPGDYPVTLRITDRATPPQESTASRTVSVAPAVGPTADFTLSNTSGPAPLLVAFTDTSTGNPGEWLWELSGIFNSGSLRMQNIPPYTFTQAGTETVTLTVSNGYGFSTKTRTITVTAAPQATCTMPACSQPEEVPYCPLPECPGFCGMRCGVPVTATATAWTVNPLPTTPPPPGYITIQADYGTLTWSCPSDNLVRFTGLDRLHDPRVHLLIFGPGLPGDPDHPAGGNFVTLADPTTDVNGFYEYVWRPTTIPGYTLSRGPYLVEAFNDTYSYHEKVALEFGEPFVSLAQVSPSEGITWGQRIHFEGTSTFCNESDVHLRVYGPGLPSEGVLFATPERRFDETWIYDWDPSKIPGYGEQVGAYQVWAWNSKETTYTKWRLIFEELPPGTIHVPQNPLTQVVSPVIDFFKKLFGIQLVSPIPCSQSSSTKGV